MNDVQTDVPDTTNPDSPALFAAVFGALRASETGQRMMTAAEAEVVAEEIEARLLRGGGLARFVDDTREHHAIGIILQLEAMTAAAEHFWDGLKINDNASDHLAATLRLMAVRIGDLRKALWGDEQGP